MRVPYWPFVIWRASVETAEMLGVGHPVRAVIGVAVSVAAILLLGIFGPVGEEQMSAEWRWFITVLVVAVVAFIPVFTWKLIALPPRLARESREAHELQVTDLSSKLAAVQLERDDAASRNFALPDQLIGSRLVKLHFRISDLAREDATIRDRQIEDCHVYGPAMIVVLDGTVMEGITFEGHLDIILNEIPAKRVLGAIGLENCVVRRCHFHKIGIIGPKNVIEMVRENTRAS